MNSECPCEVRAPWRSRYEWPIFVENPRIVGDAYRIAQCLLLLSVFQTNLGAQPSSLIPGANQAPNRRPGLSTLIPPNKPAAPQTSAGPSAPAGNGQSPSAVGPGPSPAPTIQRPVYTIPKLPAGAPSIVPPIPPQNAITQSVPNAGPAGSALPPIPMGMSTNNSPASNSVSPFSFASQQANGTSMPEARLVSANPTQLAQPPAAPFKAGELICVVGEERILAGDMALYIEPTLEQLRSRLTESQEHEVRAKLIRQALPRYVATKALYQAFLRDVVGRAPLKDQKEARQNVLSKANKVFHERQVPNEQKRYKVDSLAALEAKLRERNFSLTMLQNQFIENVLARQVENEIPQKYDIERDQLWKHYQDHADQWKRPAVARWRQLTARFDKHPSRQAAEQLINEMFGEVFYGGKRFEVVAQQKSQGYTASKGGVYDWTTQGSLKSTKIDQAIFTYDLAKLSPVIEDEIGLHIVEVLERKPAHVVPFEDAQSEISKLLSDQRREEEVQRLHDQILKRTAVWTRWPEDIPGSRSLQDALGETNAP